MPESLPAGGTQHNGRLLLVGALRLHQRNQLARDERKGHEHRRQDDAGHGKHDFDVVLGQPGPDPALRAKHQHVNQTRHHRRHRERQVDQRGQKGLALELVFGHGPGGRHTKHQVQRHRHRRGQQRQPDGAPGIGLVQGFQRGRQALAQGFGEHRGQRQQQEQSDQTQRQRDQRPAHPGGLGGAGPGLATDKRAHDLPPARRRCQLCRPLMTSSSTNEMASITVATAVAPA